MSPAYQMPNFTVEDWTPEHLQGSSEFDMAFAAFSGEEVRRRVRFGVYYEDDYDWFEVIRG